MIIDSSSYFETIDIWKSFCELHFDLFNLTCEEYSFLLGSEIEKLEELVVTKNTIIAAISIEEKRRQKLIEFLSQELGQDLTSVRDLVDIVEAYESTTKESHFKKFNGLLIDLIEKIQIQNKKNQIFLNKAILSLQEIRQGAIGQKKYTTYDSKGSHISSTAR